MNFRDPCLCCCRWLDPSARKHITSKHSCEPRCTQRYPFFLNSCVNDYYLWIHQAGCIMQSCMAGSIYKAGPRAVTKQGLEPKCIYGGLLQVLCWGPGCRNRDRAAAGSAPPCTTAAAATAPQRRSPTRCRCPPLPAALCYSKAVHASHRPAPRMLSLGSSPQPSCQPGRQLFQQGHSAAAEGGEASAGSLPVAVLSGAARLYRHSIANAASRMLVSEVGWGPSGRYAPVGPPG